VRGPDIIARTLSASRPVGPSRAMWQYHSRSDHHSKLACWAIAFDLLSTSSLLRQHVGEGKVTIGVNHEMVDFKLSRKKNLDLVIARPSDEPAQTKPTTLAEIAEGTGIVLSDEDRAEFEALPEVEKLPVGSVLMALEAKACMTAHNKSEPRLYDELNSSQQTIHGAADQAIAVGLAIVNIADTFISPGLQKENADPVITQHNQPAVTLGVIEKLRELPRRTATGTEGFDAFGIVVVELRNDGTPVRMLTGSPAPEPSEQDTYANMVMRAANLYDYRFGVM
jgi:hypothetical protein